MERWFYAMLAALVCAPLVAVILYRPDLRHPLWWCGIYGAAVEFFAEFWYRLDYWHPPVLLTLPGPEDVLYGFGATAIAAVVYPLVFRQEFRNYPGPRRLLRATVCTVSFFAMMEIGHLFGLPSIWVATGSFLSIGAAVNALRWSEGARVPLKAAVVTGLMCGALAFACFAVALNFPWLGGDHFLRDVYMPYHTRLGVGFLGVPVDEVCWNITRGWAVISVYMFAMDAELEPL